MAKIAMLGDSLTQRGTNGQETKNTYLSGYLETVLGPSFVTAVYNNGVGGDTLANMLARVTDVTSTDADIVFMQGGGNDLLGADTPLATMKENFINIASAVRNAGKLFVASTIIPISSLSVEKQQRWNDFNDFLRGLPNSADSLVNCCVDLKSVNYNPVTETYDDVHPNVPGSLKLGRKIAVEVGKFIRNFAISAYSEVSEYYNDNMFGLGGTAGTGFAGSMADGWQTQIYSGTLSGDIDVSPSFNNKGNGITLSHNNLSVSTGASVNSQVISTLGSLAVTSGDKFFGEAVVSGKGVKGVVGAALAIRFTDASQTKYVRAWALSGFSDDGDKLPEEFTIKLHTPVFTAGTGCTLDYLRLEVAYRDGSTEIAGDINILNPRIVQVS